MIAVVKVKSLMRKTNARLAMVKKLLRKRRSSKLRSTKVLQTTNNMFSMARLMSTPGWKQVMLS